MFEGPQILGIFAAGLLVVALVAWVKLLRGPPLQPLDGRVPADERTAETASQLLVVALALCAGAALMALWGLFAA